MSEIHLDHQQESSSLQPILNRFDRVERSLAMVSRVLHLELSDLILDGTDTQQRNQDAIRAAGIAAVRIATIANEIAASSRAQLNPIETTELQDVPSAEPAASLHVELIPKPQATLAPRPAPAPAISEPIQSEKEETTVAEENPLYANVVPVSQIPFMELPENAQPVKALVGDNSVSINGKTVKLVGEKLFVFNSLMLQRGGLVSNEMIKDQGFRGDTPAFHAAVNAVLTQLNRLTEDLDIEIIKKVGERRNVRYAVNPTLQLTETRDDIGEIIVPTPEGLKKN